MRTTNRRAYSLVELMVVVAIISLLVAVGVPNLLEAETRSRLARTKADMHTIATALALYSADHSGHYPPAPADPAVTPQWQGSQHFFDNAGFGLTTPVAYMAGIPHSVFLARQTSNSPGAGFYLFNYKYHRQLNQSLPEAERCLFADHAMAAGAEYVIWTLGPNKGNPASSDGTVYDPTNGNVSRGRVAWFSDRRIHPDIYNVRP